jgi:hypothetical protein
MAATLAVVVLSRIATMLWLRPHLLPAKHVTASLLDAGQFGFLSRDGTAELVATGAGPDNSWTLSSQLRTSSGHTATPAQIAAFVRHYCPAVLHPPALSAGQGGHKVLAPPSIQAFQSCRAQSRANLPPTGHLPAIRPLLAAAMARVRRVQRPRSAIRRRLLLVGHPAQLSFSVARIPLSATRIASKANLRAGQRGSGRV